MAEVIENAEQKFTTCFIKKSRYYYKFGLETVGLAVILLIAFGVFLYIINWILNWICPSNSPIILGIFIIDILVITVVSLGYALSEYCRFWKYFIQAFIECHVLWMGAVCFGIIFIICLFGIPMALLAFTWLYITYMTNNILVGFVAGLITCGLIFPLNYTLYDCFKIKEWMKIKWKNFIKWEALKDV
jgi:hypothetical protein